MKDGSQAVVYRVGWLQNYGERLSPQHITAGSQRARLTQVQGSSVGHIGRAECNASDSLRRSLCGRYPAPENREQQQSGIDGDAVSVFASCKAESASEVEVAPPMLPSVP